MLCEIDKKENIYIYIPFFPLIFFFVSLYNYTFCKCLVITFKYYKISRDYESYNINNFLCFLLSYLFFSLYFLYLKNKIKGD
jgi:hypothetical protein